MIDFTQPDLIRKIDLATGVELNSFSSIPSRSNAFEIEVGDLEIHQDSGNLFLVSNLQDVIRELTPTDAFIQNIDVSALGIADMSGIAFDDTSGEVWISSNGTVDHLDRLASTTAVPLEFSPRLGSIFAAILLGYHRLKQMKQKRK